MLYHLFQTLVNGISLMTRQECVIRIAKINKVFGELKYRIDIEEVPNFASFVPILLMTREWAVDIRLYVNQEPSPTLVRQIANIGMCSIRTRTKKRNRRYFQHSAAAAIFLLILLLLSLWGYLMKQNSRDL